VQIELEVASLAPRAFLIPEFLSAYETDEIIRIARPQIHNSFVGDNDGGGARESDTRTSRNAWVGRKSSAVTETLYVRAAHLLKLDEKLLNTNTNAEDMQVVHYVNGQKYDSHHDWGVSGYPESRFITLLLYLTDMEDEFAGGETAFPKGADGLGFKVSPRKGSAVLFYNLLEDGNGDDLALHAALPVYRGEKWLANFWVWDPIRR
jgi:prolyl 4-hydroxylase